MKTVKVNTTGGAYEVVIGAELDLGRLLLKVKHACHLCIVSDDIVFSLYGERVTKALRDAGYTVDSYVFKHGEVNKRLETVENILEFCAEKKLSRTDLIVALGGGVVGDIAGFSAAIYLRGIDFVQIPTTVLAAVDSSVGGKTGADLSAGKNLVGAFHQPIGVFLDVSFFTSLPEVSFHEGLAEAIKYGMIMDRELFEAFEKGIDDIEYICQRCIEDKAKIVKLDEFDTGLRQILNFGHTPGHAIEKLSGYEISHGNAVAIGMLIMTKASVKYNMLNEDCIYRLERVLKQYKLPTETDLDARSLAMVGMNDKKIHNDTLNLVLLEDIGQAVLKSIKVKELEEYFS